MRETPPGVVPRACACTRGVERRTESKIMSAHTVISHARLQEIKDARGVSSVAMPSEFVLVDTVPVQGALCAQCSDFGDTVAATHVATYRAERADAVGDRTEILCLPCASNPRIYCGVRPLRTGGVSLVKATDGMSHWNAGDLGCGPVMGPCADFLYVNSLPLLAEYFRLTCPSDDGGFFETV